MGQQEKCLTCHWSGFRRNALAVHVQDEKTSFVTMIQITIHTPEGFAGPVNWAPFRFVALMFP